MRTCTVEFSGGGDASGSKRMRAICVAGRSRVNSCCCVPAYTPETGRICAIFPGMRRLPNSTKTSCPTVGSIRRSLGMYQSTKMSVGSRISAIGVPAVSDWPISARPVEIIPATGARTRALAEMALHLIETTSKLLDELIKRGKLNGGLGDFRLRRDHGFAGRGVFTQNFHAEGHRGRGHGAQAFDCFLGHELIRARGFEKVLRDPRLDAQFRRAAGDVRQRAHIGRDDAVLLR